MAAIKIHAPYLAMLAQATNQRADRESREFAMEQNRQTQMEMQNLGFEHDQNMTKIDQAFRTSQTQEERDYLSGLQAQSDKDYAQAIEALAGSLSQEVPQLEAPPGPGAGSGPATTEQPNYGGGPGFTGATTQVPQLSMPAAPAPGVPAGGGVPDLTAGLQGLSLGARAEGYRMLEPGLTTQLTENITGVTADREAMDAASQYYYQNLDRLIGLTDRELAAEMQNLPSQDPVFMRTFASLSRVEDIVRQTEEDQNWAELGTRLERAVGTADAVWTMKDIYKWGDEEIAEIMGMTVEAVRDIPRPNYNRGTAEEAKPGYLSPIDNIIWGREEGPPRAGQEGRVEFLQDQARSAWIGGYTVDQILIELRQAKRDEEISPDEYSMMIDWIEGNEEFTEK